MVLPWNIPTLVMKPWRLFRELDCYTDAECESLLSRSLGARVMGLIIAIVLTLIFGVISAIVITVCREHAFGQHSQWNTDELMQGRLVLAPIYAVCTSIILTMAFVPYSRMVLSSVQSKLGSISCDCGYLMLGLSVAEGRVTCPECGVVHTLVERGWEERDIVTGASERDEIRYVHMDWRRSGRRISAVLGLMVAWIFLGPAGALVAALVVTVWMLQQHAAKRV